MNAPKTVFVAMSSIGLFESCFLTNLSVLGSDWVSNATMASLKYATSHVSCPDDKLNLYTTCFSDQNSFLSLSCVTKKNADESTIIH